MAAQMHVRRCTDGRGCTCAHMHGCRHGRTTWMRALGPGRRWTPARDTTVECETQRTRMQRRVVQCTSLRRVIRWNRISMCSSGWYSLCPSAIDPSVFVSRVSVSLSNANTRVALSVSRSLLTLSLSLFSWVSCPVAGSVLSSSCLTSSFVVRFGRSVAAGALVFFVRGTCPCVHTAQDRSSAALY